LCVGLFFFNGFLGFFEDKLEQNNSQRSTSEWKDIVDPNLVLPAEGSIKELTHGISQSNS